MTIQERQALDERIYKHNAEVDATRASILEAENRRKQQEADDLAQKRRDEAKQFATTQAADLARQKLMTDLVAKGTNSINALWEAAKIIPFPKVSDQLAVETAHAKANIPVERFGETTRTVNGETLFGQTNNAGRFFPLSVPKPPKEGEIKLQVGDTGKSDDFITTPIPSSTNVLKTLPPDLQTNQFNTASMASIPQGPQAPAAPAQPATVNEVVRVTKDGRKAIFDGNTKAFLRYAD